MKKTVALILTLVMATTLAFSMTACTSGDDTQESKVMTVELNPQVEFILDGENKVVSVNAMNDEGNYVVAEASFVGMSAEEAYSAFLQISVENGFVVKGSASAGDNTVTISISGDDAQAIYDSVKAKGQEYLDTLEEDFNVAVEYAKIQKENLEELVADCMRELDADAIKEKTEAELLALLKESRSETENLLSQELKDCYYEERALEIKKAAIDTLIEAIENEDAGAIATKMLTTAKATVNNLYEAITNIKNQYKELFLSTTSEYYTQMQSYIAAKKELLEARLNDASEATLTVLETAFAACETTINATKTACEATLETLEGTATKLIDTAYEALESIAETLNITAQNVTDIVNSGMEEAKNNFKQSFTDENGDFILNNYWAALKPEQAE